MLSKGSGNMITIHFLFATVRLNHGLNETHGTTKQLAASAMNEAGSVSMTSNHFSFEEFKMT